MTVTMYPLRTGKGVQWGDETGTQLVRPNGSSARISESAPAAHTGAIFPILPTNATTLWTTDKSASITVSVDFAVTFGGQPSIRIDIPANTSGTLKVGTSGANCVVPSSWGLSNAVLAVRYSHADAMPGLTWYLGDSTYTNFWISMGFSGANIPELKPEYDEWIVYKPDAVGGGAVRWSVSAGAPTIAAKMRSKIQWTSANVAHDASIWIGAAGVMPSATPTVILSFDDGFSTWDSFVKPIAKHYGLPCSFAISSALVGAAGYLTAAQIQALHADESGLFDIVNHMVDTTGYTVLGASAAYAQMVACRDYLRGLGVTGDGPLHVPYVSSQYNTDLIELMLSGGFLSARQGTVSNGWDQRVQTLAYGDKVRFELPVCKVPQTGVTVADVQTAVNGVVSSGGVGFINFHNFADADGAYIWAYEKFAELAKWLYDQRAGGTIQIKSWSRWFRDTAGYGGIGSHS